MRVELDDKRERVVADDDKAEEGKKKRERERKRVLSVIEFVPVCCVAVWVIMESPHRSAEDQTQDAHRRGHMKER